LILAKIILGGGGGVSREIGNIFIFILDKPHIYLYIYIYIYGVCQITKNEKYPQSSGLGAHENKQFDFLHLK